MLDLTKLKEALQFQPRPRSSRPGKMLEVRITVQQVDEPGGLLWDIGDAGSGPRGGQRYVRPADTASAILGMLALRLDEMEREVRRDIAKAGATSSG
jgi:hypothetical protein